MVFAVVTDHDLVIGRCFEERDGEIVSPSGFCWAAIAFEVEEGEVLIHPGFLRHHVAEVVKHFVGTVWVSVGPNPAAFLLVDYSELRLELRDGSNLEHLRIAPAVEHDVHVVVLEPFEVADQVDLFLYLCHVSIPVLDDDQEFFCALEFDL